MPEAELGRCDNTQDAGFLSNPRLELILFGGKGGSGKTTSATATALQLARQSPGQRVLLVSTDPAHSLSDSLDCAVGSEVTPIAGVDNLAALALDATSLLEAFKQQNGAIIKLIASRGTYFDQDDIAGFFELSLPGLDEVMAIIKITDLMKQEGHDLVILDTAPAGHTIRLLTLPQHMQQWVHVLDMMMDKHRFMKRRFAGRYVPDEADRFLAEMEADVRRVQDLLKNPETTEFVPVVTPEALSICETETLFRTLREAGIPVHSVILNRFMDLRLSVRPGAHSCPFCQLRESDQMPFQQEIREKFAGYNLLTVPLFPHEIRGLADLAAYAGVLFNTRPISGWQKPVVHNKTPVVVGRRSPAAGEAEPCGLIDLLRRDLQFIFFGGKGGVGKTTLAAATAMEVARREPEKKTLVFSCDPAGTLADSLGCVINDVPTPVTEVPGLFAMQINAAGRLEDLNQRYRGEINEVFDGFLGGSMDVAFDRDVMLELMTLIPPGLDEIVALISILDLLEEGCYSRFILDTAATGHMLRFLELPQLALDWFRTLFQLLVKYQGVVTLTKTAQLMFHLSRNIRKLRRYMVDARHSELVAVTIPEAMGLFETQRFLATLERLQIPCRHLVVNMVMPPTACDFCLAKRDEQQVYISSLHEQFCGYAVTELPLSPREIRGLAALKEIGRAMYGNEGG